MIRVRTANTPYLTLRIHRNGCLILFILSLAAIIALITFTLQIDRILTLTAPPTPSDAIVVLASEPHRVQHAVALYEQGYAPWVVFTDATYQNTDIACASAPLDTQAAEALGLPADAILVAPGNVTSTYDEAVAVRQLASNYDWQSLLIVTDPFHTRRAVHTFRALIPDVTITANAARDPGYDPQHWWRTEEGIMAALTEIIKTIFYWAAYRIAV